MATTRARRKTGSKGDPVESRDKELLLRIFETMVLMRADTEPVGSAIGAGRRGGVAGSGGDKSSRSG